MEMFNVLPTRNEDAIGVLSSMLETAVFLRNSNFDRISSELIDASCEYINALKKYSQPYNHPKVKPTAVDLPTYTPNNIGYRIQLARENLGMSLDALAAAVIPGDVEVLLEWENNKSEPCASEIIRLSQALKCDPMWLLTGESSNHQYPATPVHQSRNQYSGQQRSDASDHASHHVKHQSQA
ncbi:helix-turn-helix domain-containing protein [Salmonella enterica]|nr:helix-turn-helix domain-containing protein [Salmonella enterica]